MTSETRNLPLEDLFRGSRWWTMFMCIAEALKHIEYCTVCVWSCATPGLGPRQMLVNTAPNVQPPAGLREAVSRPIKMVTVLLHKVGHIYMWFRLTDPFQLVSAKTKEAGSHLGFGSRKQYQSLFFQRSASIYWLYYKPLRPLFHFFSPLIIILLWRAGLFVIKSKWRRFWLQALSWIWHPWSPSPPKRTSLR